jgi:hemerythrin
MTIQWEEGLRLGMTSIDTQHEEIFDYFDKLTEAIQKGDGRSEAVGLLKYLENYSSIHFDDEEKMMEDCKYPYVDEQRKQHHAFKDNIAMLAVQLAENVPSQEISIKIDAVLIKYFINHVRKLDKALADFIKLQPV